MTEEIFNQIKRMLTLVDRALQIYIKEGQEKIIEKEEYSLYKEQYPFDEYYYFREVFKSKWE